MIRRIHILILFIAALSVTGCPVDTSIDQSDAYNQIYAAIDYKAKECGTSPAYPLILPDTPSNYGVELCSLTIIRLECPFNDYPLLCLEAYNYDVPGIGP